MSSAPTSSASRLSVLPDEILLCILGSFEEPLSLLLASRINQQFLSLSRDELLWRNLFQTFSYQRTSRDEEQNTSYRVLFKQRYGLDRNWRCSDKNAPYEVHHDIPRLAFGQNRVVTALAACGGSRPVVAAAYAGSHVQVYDLSNKTVMMIPGDDVRTLALVLDDERFKEQPSKKHLPGVSRGWGLNGLVLVTGGRKIKIWNVPCKTGMPTFSMQDVSGPRCFCAISGTSQLLSGSRDGSVKLWDMQTGAMIRELSGFADGVFCLDCGYNDQGTLLAVGGSMDCSGRIWNLETDEFKVLRGHRQAIHRVMINGNIVISGSLDSTVRTWSLATGEPLCVITTHRMPASHIAAINCPTRSLVSVCFDGTVAVHSLEDEMGRTLPIPQSSKGFNLHRKSIIEVGNCDPYFVAGGLDNVLSIFRPVKAAGATSLGSLEGKAPTPVQLVRCIETGLLSLYRVAVIPEGIVTIGASPMGRTCLQFYSFAANT